MVIIMIECPECNFNNDNDEKSCTECGADLDIIFCPECNAGNEPDDRFCEKCGTELPMEKEAEPEPEIEAEEAPAPVEKKPKKKEKPAKEDPKKKAPKKQPEEETVIKVKMKFPQNEATKIANKQLADDGGKLFKKKIEKVDAVLLKYLPLVQASFDIEKKKGFLGMGGKEKEIENLYFHGMTGKLLQVTDKLSFSDITQDKAENIKDFDGISTLGTLKASMLPKGTEKPKIGEKYISKKLIKMFGANLKGIKTVYLPVFKFKIVNMKTKKPRVLYVDSVFGIPTDKNPFK